MTRNISFDYLNQSNPSLTRRESALEDARTIRSGLQLIIEDADSEAEGEQRAAKAFDKAIASLRADYGDDYADFVETALIHCPAHAEGAPCACTCAKKL